MQSLSKCRIWADVGESVSRVSGVCTRKLADRSPVFIASADHFRCRSLEMTWKACASLPSGNWAIKDFRAISMIKESWGDSAGPAASEV